MIPPPSVLSIPMPLPLSLSLSPLLCVCTIDGVAALRAGEGEGEGVVVLSFGDAFFIVQSNNVKAKQPKSVANKEEANEEE
jgi:hypothetical protein